MIPDPSSGKIPSSEQISSEQISGEEAFLLAASHFSPASPRRGVSVEDPQLRGFLSNPLSPALFTHPFIH